jgi:hypothetical protein
MNPNHNNNLGVELINAVVFTMQQDGEELSTHLFGKPVGMGLSWQVCSPIRSIEKVEFGYRFITRSYKAYFIDECDFQTEFNKESLDVFLKMQRWGGDADVGRILFFKDFNTAVLYKGA